MPTFKRIDRRVPKPRLSSEQRSTLRITRFAMTLLLFCAPGVAAEVPSSEAVALAVEQLGDARFQVRQQATEFLWAIGPAIRPQLEQAAASLDPEVRLRANSILDRYRHGIFVETPQPVVKLINQFRYGDEREQRRAYRQLAVEGSVETLLALLELVTKTTHRTEIQKLLLDRLEADEDVDRIVALTRQWRQDNSSEILEQRIQVSLRRQVPRLLLAGRRGLAESILVDAATSDPGMRDWAVYLLLEGRLSEEIKAAAAAAGSDPIKSRRLVHLWRVAGELDQARRAAERLGEDGHDLLRGLLLELRDWEGLASLMVERIDGSRYPTGRNVEAFGYAAAAFRLSGDEQQFQQVLAKLEALAEANSSMDKWCAEALLVNHEIEKGLAIHKQRLDESAFEMLCVQDRYQDAFLWAGLPNPHDVDANLEWFRKVASKASGNVASTNRRFLLAASVARALYQLGERDQALRAWDMLADAVRSQRGNSLLEAVMKAELRVGLWRRASRRAATILAKSRYPDPFPHLFPRNTDAARFWWRHLMEVESLGSREALVAAARLLKVLPDDVDPQQALRRIELARGEGVSAEAIEQLTAEEADRLIALAETCFLHERADWALPLLKAAATQRAAAATKLADLAAERSDWIEAERWYGRAIELEPSATLPRYLHGHALEQLGRKDEGLRQRRLAKLLPLANSQARRQLAAGLRQRGLSAEAAEQWKLIVCSADLLASLTGGFQDTALIDAIQQIGNSTTDDLLRRTNYWELMHLSCLEAKLHIPNYRGYFHTPYVLHKTRAQAYLQQGDPDRALEEIEISQAFMPGNIELAEHLVPPLREAGRESAADRLFEQTYAFVAAICLEFPDSPLHHNNLAWLSARCDRRLDEALSHARRALELAPDTPSYLDTLGEVHFRRGEFEQAVQCAERCLELDADNDFFREQLVRFQRARDGR